jgi:hypothetical protein
MAHYGAVLHRSPAPMAVVGSYYPNGVFRKSIEIYRTPVTESAYNVVVKRIRRQGGTNEQMDEKLFQAFKPTMEV